MVFSELIALYLFLGGTAAGAFAVMSTIDLRESYASWRRFGSVCTPCHDDRTRAVFIRRLSVLAYGASLCLLAVGMLCLLADLGRPQAFYYLFLYPTSSFMSIGSFALTLLAVCMAVAFACSVLDLPSCWSRVAFVAKIAGAASSVAVMLYTGMLLKTVISVEVWQSAWLPVLFFLSALSCGCALVVMACVLSAEYRGAHVVMRRLAEADAAFIVLEACVATLYALSVNASNAQRPFDALLFGDQAWLFWAGFAACGIAIPLLTDAGTILRRRDCGASSAALVASFVMMGGIALRFALVGAGIQTAV